MDITSRKAGDILVVAAIIVFVLDMLVIEICFPAPEVMKDSIQMLIQLLIISPFMFLLIYRMWKIDKRKDGK